VPSQSRGPGRFSDTFPPECRSIRLDGWPESDRLAFERARRVGDIFELPGPAALWTPQTCRVRERHYGRYLNFLCRQDLLLDTEGPVDRMVAERLTLYLAEASRFLSARTIDQSLIELRQILRAMVPEKDWRWIMRHPGCPSTKEIRTSKKPKQAFDAMALCCKALDLMDQVSASVPAFQLRILYRNALIIAIQCVFALRRRNLVDMTLDRNLILGDGVIHLVFGADETKNYSPIRCTMPEFLKPYLLTYLREHRPALLAGNVSDAVWISSHRDALDYGALATLFASIGPRLLGHPINCHSFRHSAATTILTKDPRKLRMVSGILTHRSLRSVNQHYDLSGEAGSRRVWEKLRRDILRGKGLMRP
jgi:integrase/recombinase XerD